MKILLTNNHLDIYAGTETWTYTMASELVRLGHEVEVFTFHYGSMARRISDSVCPVVIAHRADAQTYDLIMINHNTCLRAVQHLKGTKIMTCHGIYPALEQPEAGADVYVAISEEVHDHLQARVKNPILIRNGIDCERFKPTKLVNKTLRNVLLISTSKYMYDFISEICNAEGLNFRQVNKTQRIWEVEKEINWADLVISLGRGALEAAACARNVIIFDKRNYMNSAMGDGILTADNMMYFARRNLSGRYGKRNYATQHEITTLLRQYDASRGIELRAMVLKHFDIRDKAKQYLELAE